LRVRVWILALSCALCASPALAAGNEVQGGLQLPGNFVAGDLGWFDLKPEAREPTLQFSFESGLSYWAAAPSLGPMLGPSDATSQLSGIGIELAVPVGESFSFTPSIGAGLQPSTDATQPGMAMELRGGAEFSYQFANDWKVGAAYFHVAEGGFGGSQPGNDVLSFSFTVPIGR
jgi:hypothetical protein